MQLICKGKTTQCLPKIDFPSAFSPSLNEKGYSNQGESFKFLDKVILPYIQEE